MPRFLCCASGQSLTSYFSRLSFENFRCLSNTVETNTSGDLPASFKVRFYRVSEILQADEAFIFLIAPHVSLRLRSLVFVFYSPACVITMHPSTCFICAQSSNHNSLGWEASITSTADLSQPSPTFSMQKIYRLNMNPTPPRSKHKPIALSDTGDPDEHSVSA